MPSGSQKTKPIVRVLLLTNYKEDKQNSMLRFGNLLLSGLPNYDIIASEVFPQSKMDRFCKGTKLKKWAGYIDKYFFFKRKIDSLFKSNSYDLIHIIDHSNSVYLRQLSRLTKAPKVTTCHDLIAIRTANEEFTLAPQTSYLGKRLQNWIKKSLNYSDHFVCDSLQTQSDLIKRIPKSKTKSKVIHLGVEKSNDQNSDHTTTLGDSLLTKNYVLHVGSDAWYKNRKGVLKSFKFHCENKKEIIDKLVLVGPKIQTHELDSELDKWIKRNTDRISILPNVTEYDLHSLYQNAKLLIFPSFIEGFGWPPLEAYANNCPAVTTKTGAIFEILKDNALYANPNNQKELNHLVQTSLLNTHKSRFDESLPTNDECANKYANLYGKIIL